ncbi:hypothetical protein PaVLD_ORF129L [Planktothrix phage PaV-LD]|uniref:hypothetical protein n=1 Tax=Planktothrix phage PaV-LD TaxID=994601 RepID=UPI000243C970|nr:hypothetical protein PaVLD_ORF129L [Planktothrix phage PaV-LD]ADZ31636.1 hypothetical protein PaVLD_ORF129L [Planktothrix phage PaV-LD]
MDIKIPEPVKAIMIGTMIGGLSSVLISLTLEPEVSEVRMGQYGGFIGLIASSTTTAILVVATRNNSQSNKEIDTNKIDSKPDFSLVLGELIQRSAENHLNALLPGSPEYYTALDLYWKTLSGENDTPNTNTQKTKTLHRNDGA